MAGFATHPTIEKTPAEILPETNVLPFGWSDFLTLIKARLTAMVLLTTACGFYLGSVGPVDVWTLVWTLLGTGAIAASAAALNQVIECEADRLMKRTADRPIAAGRLHPDAGLAIGVGLVLFGLWILLEQVNLPTAFLAALTLGLYVFVYTPLKRVTTLNTAVGAVPGALPTLVGWTAAAKEWDPTGLWLFALLYFWQVPHFLAIAWLYREDYERAGFRMLPSVDAHGEQTSIQAVIHAVALVPISLIPYLFAQVSVWAAVIGLVLGVIYTWGAGLFFRQRHEISARKLFLTSILYLPLILTVMVCCKRS